MKNNEACLCVCSFAAVTIFKLNIVDIKQLDPQLSTQFILLQLKASKSTYMKNQMKPQLNSMNTIYLVSRQQTRKEAVYNKS